MRWDGRRRDGMEMDVDGSMGWDGDVDENGIGIVMRLGDRDGIQRSAGAWHGMRCYGMRLDGI
jgi:hypothetical protein